MFGIAVGLLTEYATGSDFVDQLKIIVSNLGIADLEWGLCSMLKILASLILQSKHVSSMHVEWIKETMMWPHKWLDLVHASIFFLTCTCRCNIPSQCNTYNHHVTFQIMTFWGSILMVISVKISRSLTKTTFISIYLYKAIQGLEKDVLEQKFQRAFTIDQWMYRTYKRKKKSYKTNTILWAIQRCTFRTEF